MQVSGIRQQNNLNCLAFFEQMTSGHKAIAAVVTFAAEHNNLSRGRIVRQHMVRHGGTGILHQSQRRHAEALAGSVVDGPHFRGGDDFHTLWILMTKQRFRQRRLSGVQPLSGLTRY